MLSYRFIRHAPTRAGLFALAWLGAAACADAAPATAPVCGLYVDGGQNALYLDGADSARLEPEQDSPRRFHLRREPGALELFDLDTGRSERYTVSADAAQIRAPDGTVYRHGGDEPCAPSAPAATPAIAQCRQDLPACAQRLAQGDRAQASALCGPQLPFACRALLDAAPLPPTQLEALCQRSASPHVCTAAAGRLWDDGQFLRAKALLEQACQLSDPVACGRTTALGEVSAAQLQSPPATQLPCGGFHAPIGNSLALRFHRDGSVHGNDGQAWQAHLADGQVTLRQRDGRQWRLRPLGTDLLLGLDGDHRFAVFFRNGDSRCDGPDPQAAQRRAGEPAAAATP